MPESNPMSILLVEDDPVDVRLVQEVLRDGCVANRLYVVRDGLEALDYLRRRGRFTDPGASPRPGLILLDLKMPRMTGQEFLAEIRSDATLADIPIIVLTTSQDESDILNLYRLKAASYILKPFQIEEFLAVLRELGGYRLTIESVRRPAVTPRR